MSDDIERFNQGLQDLIFIREKLNAELTGELSRSDRLAKAVRDLQSLNDAAQNIIEDTLYRIGVWKNPVLPEIEPDSQETIAPRFAPNSNGHDALRKVVNGSYGIN